MTGCCLFQAKKSRGDSEEDDESGTHFVFISWHVPPKTLINSFRYV